MRAVVRIAADHPAFAGHFPGQPLLPGVALLAKVLEAVRHDTDLAAALGAAPRLASAKFLAPVRPGDTLELEIVRRGERLAFGFRRGDTLVASGQFEPGAGTAA